MAGNSTPRVSVIIPTYNGKRFLRRAVESVLTQSLADLELIIIDDGSTDGTWRLVEELAARDKRITALQRPVASGGPTIPKNMGIHCARGDYLSFLDHDDYYETDKLQVLCKGLDAHPDWVAAFHDLRIVDAQERPQEQTYLAAASFCQAARHHLHSLGDSWYELGQDFYSFMSLHYTALHTDSVVLARHRLTADPVSFRTRFKGCDDADLWFRVGYQGKLGYCDKALASHRLHGANLSANRLDMTKSSLEVHRDNERRGADRLDNDQRQHYRRKITDIELQLAYQLRRAGRRRESAELCLNLLAGRHALPALRELLKLPFTSA